MLRSLKVTQPRSKLIALTKAAGTKTVDFLDANIAFDDFLDAACIKETDTFTDALVGFGTFTDGDVTVVGDNINIAGHNFVTGDKVTLTSTGVLPTGLALATDYYVSVVDAANILLCASLSDAVAGTAVDITAAGGGGTHSVLASSVTFASAHGLSTGDAVTLTATAALPTGLVAGTVYYVSVLSSVKLAFCSSAINAAADTRVAITSPTGGGTHTMTHLTDAITITAHPFVSLDKVQLTSTGTLPSGLALATDYYVIYVDANTIKLASSSSNALAGTAVPLLSALSTGTHRICNSLVTSAGHGFTNGDRIDLTNDGGALPTGLSATSYYVIVKSSSKFGFATTLANAVADTRVQITNPAGGGTHTTTDTDKLTGFDSLQGHSVAAQGTGIYRITFAVPFGHTNYHVAVTPLTADQVPYVLTKNSAYVDIKINEIDETGAFVDGNFDIMIMGSEQSDIF